MFEFLFRELLKELLVSFIRMCWKKHGKELRCRIKNFLKC